MLTERQLQILKMIVQEFVKTNKAVGSKRLLELLESNISSATIRNECAFLEKMEFLEKQHTSSGRVPSTKGYRFYVDNLMNDNNEMLEQLRTRLKIVLSNRANQIDTILDNATRIISEMTKMSVILVKNEDNSHIKLKSMQLVALNKDMASAIFVLSNGQVQKKVFNLNDISLEDLTTSINLFSDVLIDTELEFIEEKIEIIKPKLEQSVKNSEFILQSFISTIIAPEHEKKEIVGMKYMLENPEFNDTEKLKKVLALMENVSPFDWYDAQYKQHQSTQKILTKIGDEVDKDIDDISIMETEIHFENESRRLTLVGPKRVDYNQANQLMQILADLLSDKERENE